MTFFAIALALDRLGRGFLILAQPVNLEGSRLANHAF